MDIPAAFRRARANLGGLMRGTPSIFLANLQITRQCTQRCRQCSIPDGAAQAPPMRLDTFVDLVDRLDSGGTHFITISGGEPLTHPDLPEMIRYAATKKFIATQVLSNLYVPDPALDRVMRALIETGTGIQVSFDGFGDVADRLRGGHGVSDRVRRNILELDRRNRERSRRIRTSLNIVVSELNLHQVPDILAFAESIGWEANVDLYRCLAPQHKEDGALRIVDLGGLNRVIAGARRSRSVGTPRVILDGFGPFLEGRQEKRCPYLDCRAVLPKAYIGPDGAMSACFGATFGNLLAQSPEQIFRSSAWREEIAAMRRCRGCWNTCFTPFAIMLRPKSIGELRALWRELRAAVGWREATAK
jgi:MoaA/NifB/PqqE/SkfB family radical SAM enzyme